MSVALLLISLLETGTPARSEPTPPPVDSTRSDEGEPNLGEEVRRVARRVEELRGERFLPPPGAVRGGREVRESVARSRLDAQLPSSRLRARGRAWADIGLGERDLPVRILERLNTDLSGIGWDSASRNLVVDPSVLTDRDFLPDAGDETGATILQATGMRPDEPLVAHLLVHLLQSRRASATPPETTDGLLARAAWREGEANLVAVLYVFRALGVADDVLDGRVDLARLLDGRLLAAPLDAVSSVERPFLEFVYLDGFEQAVRVYRKGGFRAVEEAAASRGTVRQILHSDRGGVPKSLSELREQVPTSLPGGLERTDLDSLGEQGIVALVSARTGKDDLALAAADGWAWDGLAFFEASRDGGAESEGVTLWETGWASSSDAEEFAYALGRCLEDGLEATRVSGQGPDQTVWSARDKSFRLTRSERRVTLRVASSEVDRRLEAQTENEPKDGRSPKSGKATTP